MTTAPARTRHLVASEWVKLRSLRSTPVGLAISALAILAVNLNAALADLRHLAPDQVVNIPLFDSFTDLADQVLMLTAGCIGAIMIVSELSSGLIRTTFVAVPRRRAVMTAKVLVLGGVMTLYGLTLSVISFVAVQAVLAGHHVAMPISNPHAIQTIVASALVAPVCALVGLAIGTVVRHSASSIVATVVVLLLLPFVFTSTNRWETAVSRLLPRNAWYHLSAEQFGGSMHGRLPSTLGAWTVYAVWTVAAIAVTTVLCTGRRDI